MGKTLEIQDIQSSRLDAPKHSPTEETTSSKLHVVVTGTIPCRRDAQDHERVCVDRTRVTTEHVHKHSKINEKNKSTESSDSPITNEESPNAVRRIPACETENRIWNKRIQ